MLNKMKTLLLNLLILIASIQIKAQNPEWKYLGNGDKVNVVLEDNDVYYMGTEAGLLVLNKSTQDVTRIDRSNSNIWGNSILGLAKEGDGSLLVASLSHGDFKGVTRHNIQGIERIVDDAGPMVTAPDGSVYMITSFGFYHITGNQFTKDTLMGYEIPGNIAINPVNGDVWYTTFTFGQYYVYKYDGNSIIKYDTNNGLPFENPVNQPIAINKDGVVYVSTYTGIYKEENGNWTNIKPIVDNEVISAIAVDEAGILHAVYQKESESIISIIQYVDGQWKLEYDGPVISYFGYSIKNIQFSKFDANRLILTTYGFGTWTHDSSGWIKLKSQAEIAEVRLTQLSYYDDNVWMIMGPVNAYDSISVLRYDGKEYLNGATGLPDNGFDQYLKILGKDAEGNLWARTQYQIYRLEDNVWVADTIILFPDFNSSYLDGVAGSNDGRTVIYYNAEAYIKTNGIWAKWNGAPESTYLPNMLWDSNNRFFVSYYDGWGYFDGNNWHNFNTNFYTSIKFEEAPNHDVYIFTGYKLSKIAANTNTIQNVSIPPGEWFSMTIDNKGYIWLASIYEITYYNGFNWITFGTDEPGYMGGPILNIEADKYDNIWIASYNSGIEIFNPYGIVTSLKPEFPSKQSLVVYPNPSNGILNLELNEEAEHHLEIYNINGSKLYTGNEFGQNIKIEVPLNIPNGVYWVRDNTNNGAISSPFILVR